MSAFDDDDIVPGAQPFLREEALRASGRCRTTATASGLRDRSAQKDRNYQIVLVDAQQKKCFAAPVVTAKYPSKKHIKLDNSLKHNFPFKAGQGEHYLHEEQIVEIPFDVLRDASTGDKSTKTKRRFYALTQPDELQKIEERFFAEKKLKAALGPLTASSVSN